jgi:hypothetical protein
MKQPQLETRFAWITSGIVFAAGASLLGTALLGSTGGVIAAFLGAIGGVMAEMISQKQHDHSGDALVKGNHG